MAKFGICACRRKTGTMGNFGVCAWRTLEIGLLLFLTFGTARALRLNQYGGYEDLVVRIESDVPPITCQQLVQDVGDAFNSASEYLSHATNGLMYFQRITLIIPPTWGDCDRKLKLGQPTSSSVAGAATVEIRRNDHPVLGSFPFTHQSQGCGKQGEKITVGYKFFTENSNSQDPSYIPKRLVHEWAKFRYGVFEEVGFVNDSVYPLSFRKSSGSEIEPNLCTNEKLVGSWAEKCADVAGVNCAFSPDLSGNENVTSSLMSLLHLPSVNTFCNSSNHNYDAPSKHNFLCRGRSVSDVIFSHPDFQNRPSLPRQTRRTPEIVVRQVAQPRYVLLIEETANMNLRDVWKYLKLAVRKFIKYDLDNGTQVGIVTMGTDSVRILANMTSLNQSVRGTLAEKLPNYPSLDNPSGSLSLRRGISQSINMLKWNGARVPGSVIILISQGTVFRHDLEGIVQLLKQEEISVATIEYPSLGDGKVASLSKETRGPYYSVREAGVGTMSHMSTYIKLINALTDIQRYYAVSTASKTPVLVHQEEFSGDSPSIVESSFSFDGSHSPGQFFIYVPSPIDPKVNAIELISPTGNKYTDQLSLLHDINVIKIDARIDQPGVWHYRIQRLGDSHQSHFVQVVTSAETSTTTTSNEQQDLSVIVFSNAESSGRLADYAVEPLILYAEVRKGPSPVLNAEVEAFISSGSDTWTVKLLDNGNGDPDLTGNDGVYSRYILPPSTMSSGTLEITVKVTTSPYRAKFVVPDSLDVPHETCCGSFMVPSESPSLKAMPSNERLVTSYFVRILNVQPSHGYPPARVGDLKIVRIVERNVSVQFTCPGDDFDQGKVTTYTLYFSKSRDGTPYVLERIQALETNLAGTNVVLNFTLPSVGVYFVSLQSTDPYGKSSLFSNIIEVVLPSDQESGDGSGLVSQQSNKMSMRLSKSEVALTVVGVLAFFILVIGLIILCICCRRRQASKKEVSQPEGGRGVFAITEVKEPIHWSASELLQEHEKRLSMYGQTGTRPGESTQNVSQPPRNHQTQPSGSMHQGTRYYSPASSTRSYRSFTDAQYRHSVDAGAGRRPTFTDYESCSSDPIIKGPTDYDTAVDSDTENVNYRTIDSYVGAMYRSSLSSNVNPAFNPSMGPPGHRASAGARYEQEVAATTSSTQVQYSNYNASFQGSSTSVNSKRRNITMV